MQGFDGLVGTWHGEGDMAGDPPMHLAADATFERLGSFLVFRSDAAEPPGSPSSVSIIGGAPEGEPQPMAYFDLRGVRRRYLTTVEGWTWRIWFAPDYDWRGTDGPGFDQRFIGSLRRTARRSRRAGSGSRPAPSIGSSTSRCTTFGCRLAASACSVRIPVRDFAGALPWYRRLFGGDPTFVATETEAGWVLAKDRSVYIEQVPERAGHAMNTDPRRGSRCGGGTDRRPRARAGAAGDLRQRRPQDHLPRSRRQRVRAGRGPELIGVRCFALGTMPGTSVR